MASEEEIRFDRSLLGVEHPVGEFEITKERILGFAKATGESEPVFVNESEASKTKYRGIIAPPTFCNIFTSEIKRPEIGLEFGDLGFHAGQAIEYKSPVRPGDKLSAKTKLKEVYAKTGRSGKMVFEVWETNFTNQNDVLTATVKESFVHRSKTNL